MKFILVYCIFLTACASGPQQAVNSLVYSSDYGGSKTDHYAYGGPFQFQVKPSK